MFGSENSNKSEKKKKKENQKNGNFLHQIPEELNDSDDGNDSMAISSSKNLK